MRFRTSLRLHGLAVVGALHLCSPVSAQRWGLTAAVGPALATQHFREEYGIGGILAAGLFGCTSRWLCVRFDATYGSFGNARGRGHAGFRPVTLLGAVMLQASSSGSVHPYVFGGLGVMAGGRAGNPYARFALEGGLGMLIGSGSTRILLEGRYVSSVEGMTLATYVPILVGVSIGLH